MNDDMQTKWNMKPRTTDEVTTLFDCKSDYFDPCTYIKKISQALPYQLQYMNYLFIVICFLVDRWRTLVSEVMNLRVL